MSNAEQTQKPGFFGRLTGWHVLGVFLLFFGIVFGANGYMAYWAISTFSGIEIDDAYQKGRAYNHNLEAMETQRKLGWTADIEEKLILGAGNRTHLQVRFADANGAPLTGLRVNGTFWRPVAKGGDRTLALVQTAPGLYEGDTDLEWTGNWLVRISAEGPQGEKFVQEKRVLIGR